MDSGAQTESPQFCRLRASGFVLPGMPTAVGAVTHMSIQTSPYCRFAVPVLSLFAVACGGVTAPAAIHAARGHARDRPRNRREALRAPAPPFCANAAGVFTAKKDPPNVLLIDRSGSMQIG